MSRRAEACLADLIARQPPGERLPSERDLAERLGLGRQPLRALLARLQAEGRIVRRHGSGTYVADPDTVLRTVAIVVDAGVRLGDDPFFMAAVEALQHAVQMAGCASPLLRWQPGQPAPTDPFIGIGSAVGGLLQSRMAGDPPAIGWMVEGDAPVGTRTSLVTLDDEAAGRAAVAHLVGRGCRGIVWVGHEERPSPRARCAGVRAACAAQGVVLRMVASGMNYEDGLAAAASIPREARQGIVAANDWLAAGLHAGLGAGRPPLIGFDGLALSERLGIASFRVPLPGIAADLVAELRRLAGEPLPPGRTLSYALELRP
jgi:hypothetical protein